MAMPKGKKFVNGYTSVSTIDGSQNYRQISLACKKQGIKIGPSNVRNVLLSAMSKIARPLCEANSVASNDQEILDLARNPQFQMSVAELLREVE